MCLHDYEVNRDDEINDDGDLAHFTLLAKTEPIKFEEAIQDHKWKKAMNEEMISIEKNGTWELSYLPQSHKAIDVKWVYKIKMKSNGEVERYKARLAVKGFEQRQGYDYEEIFSPVARMDTSEVDYYFSSPKALEDSPNGCQVGIPQTPT